MSDIPASRSWSRLFQRWRNRGAPPTPTGPIGPIVTLEISNDPMVEDLATYGLTSKEFQPILDISQKVNTKQPSR